MGSSEVVVFEVPLPFGFVFASFAWELSFGLFRLAIFFLDPSLGDFCLGAFAWDLRLGKRLVDTGGGILGAVFVCLVIKSWSENPSE